jgi:hypothetical protein
MPHHKRFTMVSPARWELRRQPHTWRPQQPLREITNARSLGLGQLSSPFAQAARDTWLILAKSLRPNARICREPRGDGWWPNDVAGGEPSRRSWGIMLLVPDQMFDSLDSELHGLSARLALPGLPPPADDAIDLALRLLIADRSTPATLDVASLSPGTTMRDAQQFIFQMLSEQHVPSAPDGSSEVEQWTVALWAFGRGGLSVSEFAMHFYGHLPALNEQDKTDREIVVLLDGWEREQSPERRLPIETRMREAALRGALDR